MKHNEDIRRVEALLGDDYCDETRAAFVALAEVQDGLLHVGMLSHGTTDLTLRAIACGLSEAIVTWADTDEEAHELGVTFSRMLANEVYHRIRQRKDPDLTLTTDITDEQKGALLQ